jgi:1,4-dihydroxy-2-naphthoate polyprenyltransferase
MSFQSWLMAARPKTLTAAIVPIVAATALAYWQGYEVAFGTVGLCLFASLCIQIATNFINDAIDFDKGADTSERIGPQRATQSGLLSRQKIFTAAAVLLILAFIAGIPLVYIGGLPIIVVGLISIFMAYSYTGGPFPLAYLGLGDLFVIIFFGLIAVGGVYYLLTGLYSFAAFILGVQIGFLSTVLIAINNLRDVNQDRSANKKTLAVRFGVRFARIEIAVLLMLPFFLQVYWYMQSGLVAAFLPLVLLPLAVHIGRQIAENEPSQKYNRYLAQSALLHAGFGFVLSVGLYVS